MRLLREAPGRVTVEGTGVVAYERSENLTGRAIATSVFAEKGRVDLGVGKAPGGLPLSTRALQALHDKSPASGFDVRFAELDAFLHNTLDPEHALAGAIAFPSPPSLPERHLLGGSPDSAALILASGAPGRSSSTRWCRTVWPRRAPG